MSRKQIHHDVVEELREAGYELDEHGNFIHTQNEEELEVVLPSDPNWYEDLLNKRELEELAKHNNKEVNGMNKADRAAKAVGKSVAVAEQWTKDTGIPMAKKGASAGAKATVRAAKALRRFGRGLAEGYKQAKGPSDKDF